MRFAAGADFRPRVADSCRTFADRTPLLRPEAAIGRLEAGVVSE